MVSAVIGLCLAGCGSDSGSNSKDCTSLCKEAQAGSCTVIKGDCAKFCASMDALASPAGCSSLKDVYLGCRGKAAKVCDTSCDSQETAVGNCYIAYCTKNPTNQDCVVLAASYL